MNIPPRRPRASRLLAIGLAVLLSLVALPAIASPASAATFTNPAVPAAPWGVTATTGINATVNISWSVPFDGGAAITDYVIQYSTDRQTWSTFEDGVSTATSAAVTGLTAGTRYHLRVGAINSAGRSSWRYLGQGSLGAGWTGACQQGPAGVYCWGDLAGSRTPSLVIPSSHALIKQVVEGDLFSCALSAAGTVACWGYEYYGVLGRGFSYSVNGFWSAPSFDSQQGGPGLVMTDTANQPLTDVVSIAAFPINYVYQQVCALRSDGSTWCWGGMPDTGVARQITNNQAIEVSGGGYTCRLLSNRSLQCSSVNGPYNFPPTSAPDAIAMSSSGTGWGCVLRSTGTVRCWAGNYNNFEFVSDISGIAGAVQVSAGVGHACALLSSGLVKCWGQNDQGQLGDGTRTDSSSGISVVGISDAVQISAGNDFTCAALASGETRCWGRNDRGQLGPNFLQASSSTPVTVSTTIGASDAITVEASRPSAPTSVVATAGNESASIAFTPGSDGGAAITKYQYSTDGGTTWTDTAAGTTSPVTITGLTNGSTYSIKLRAVNAAGAGSPSAAVSAVAATAPNAPTAPLVVISGTSGGRASVSWTAPANGGSAITKYEVTATGGATPIVKTISNPATLTQSFTGLSSTTTYTFTVKALNAVGKSAASPGTSLVPAAVPAKPDSVAFVSAGNGSIAVSYTAPVSNGGSAITGYLVQAFTPSITSAVISSCQSNATTFTCTVTGLTNGVRYELRVFAQNVVGASTAFSKLVNVKAGAAPAAPGSPQAIANSGKTVTVSWTAPNSNGSTINAYTVQAYKWDGTTSTKFGGKTCSTNGSAYTCNVTGLPAGAQYTFTVTATNAVGIGIAATTSAVTARS